MKIEGKYYYERYVAKREERLVALYQYGINASPASLTEIKLGAKDVDKLLKLLRKLTRSEM